MLMDQIADRMTGGKITRLEETAVELQNLQEERRTNSLELELLKENMQRLEQALHSPGWRLLAFEADQEFTTDALKTMIDLCRIMKLKNPIIRRSVELKRLYTWAQGVEIKAQDDDINEVIQTFVKDERNQAELFSHQARGEAEENLQTDGNIFFRFHINRLNGRIKVSSVDPTEVVEIVTNPNDKKEPWFYKRTFNVRSLTGEVSTKERYYPDFRYRPSNRSTPAGWVVEWDTPIYHVRVNPKGRFGIPEVYSGLDWAKSYKEFLEQLATVWQSLARWAYKLTTKHGSKGVAAAKKKLATTVDSSGSTETNPPPVTGSTFISTDAIDLQPFRTQGATMSAEDGRRLLLMTLMNFGFPETFYSDVSVGTLATAKSLDRPTELLIMDRQALWTDIFKTIFNFVLYWAIKAPQGPLRGVGNIKIEVYDGEKTEEVEFPDNIDPTVNVEFPAIIESDTGALVAAIIQAQGMDGGKGIPLETAVRRLMVELNFADVDAVMTIWKEEQEERAKRAEEMKAMMQNGDGPDDEGEDEDSDEDAPDDEEVEEAFAGAMAQLDEAIEALTGETAVEPVA